MNQHRVLSCLRRQLTTMVAPALLTIGMVGTTEAGFVTYKDNGDVPAEIQPVVDAFRAAIPLRQDINWDGVPAARSDPNPMPADQFRGRGAVFSTPGTGFLVSANAGGATPPLFGFPDDHQTFSAQKLFTAVNSNITDVHFVLPGTSIPATTSAFGVVFVDVEVPGLTHLEFFDKNDQLIFSDDPEVVGTSKGLSFLGALGDAGEQIARVRITAGLNTIVANGVRGNPNDEGVVMDDFIFATPAAVPVPATLALFALGLVLAGVSTRRRSG